MAGRGRRGDGRRAEMSSFVDGLELSVRTTNVLKLAGVETREAFEALDAGKVLAMRNAGRKTWYEIRDVQGWLKGPTREERERLVAALLEQACRQAREWLAEEDYRIVNVGRLDVRLVRLVP